MNTIPMSTDLIGIPVTVSEFAVERRRWYEVAAWPIRKRRRNYRVMVREESIPGCYQLADGTLVIHPDIYAQFSKATPK